MKFRRQQPVGRYTVDFICQEARLIVEADGGHHNEDSAAARDVERTRFLEQAGYCVLRFWNNEVQQNIEGVLVVIEQQLITPHPNPLPQGERGRKGPGCGKQIVAEDPSGNPIEIFPPA